MYKKYPFIKLDQGNSLYLNLLYSNNLIIYMYNLANLFTLVE